MKNKLNRITVIHDLKKYFDISELVGKATYDRYGNDAWQFFQTDALHCLLIIRKGVHKPISVNNWNRGGSYDERGLRTNVQEILKRKTEAKRLYLSGHVLGCAFDFKIKGMQSELVREWIIDNADLFPCKIRLEHKKNGVPISWVHFDTKQLDRNPKVYLFNV